MHTTATLNNLYESYAAGSMDKKNLEEAIFTMLKNDEQLSSGWNPEDFNDYVSWLYPRIRQAINNYNEEGSSFGTYVGAMLRLSAKEFRYRQMRNYTAESAAWVTQIPDMRTCEPEVEYIECDAKKSIQPEKMPLKLNNPRQLLILVLKCCGSISLDFAERISAYLEMPPDTLMGMFSQLKEMRKKRENEILRLRGKSNNLFCQYLYCDQLLRAMPEENCFTQRLREQREQKRKRLTVVRKRLSSLQPNPSNSQIAKLLGLSKSTVDSTLHTLKTRGFHFPKGGKGRHMLN